VRLRSVLGATWTSCRLKNTQIFHYLSPIWTSVERPDVARTARGCFCAHNAWSNVVPAGSWMRGRGLRCVSRGQLRALSSECRKSGVNILTARSANFNKQLSLIIILLMRCNALLALLAGSHRRAHHHLQVNKQTIYVQTRWNAHTLHKLCATRAPRATSWHFCDVSFNLVSNAWDLNLSQSSLRFWIIYFRDDQLKIINRMNIFYLGL